MAWRFLGKREEDLEGFSWFVFFLLFIIEIKNGSFLFFYGHCMWGHAHKRLKSHLGVKHENLGLDPKGNNGWNQINNEMKERLGH